MNRKDGIRRFCGQGKIRKLNIDTGGVRIIDNSRGVITRYISAANIDIGGGWEQALILTSKEMLTEAANLQAGTGYIDFLGKKKGIVQPFGYISIAGDKTTNICYHRRIYEVVEGAVRV